MALGIGPLLRPGVSQTPHGLSYWEGDREGGNSPSLGPEFHQHQNLLAIRITEGLGNRRRDILPAGQP